MNISKKGLDLIKHYEQFMARPYLCPAGVVTIGYGTTVYENGKKVTLRDPGITEGDACALLQADVLKFSDAVNSLAKVPLTQGQYDALVSFCYNLGAGALQKSTLLRYINAGVMDTNPGWKRVITIEFSKWVMAAGRKLGGLVARRHSEAWLFCEGDLKFFTSKKS